VTARVWALAVLIAVWLTTAAYLGVVWLGVALIMLLPLAGVGVAQLVAGRRVSAGRGGVDREAFEFVSRMVEGTLFQLKNLSDADRAGARGARLRAELRYLRRAASAQLEDKTGPVETPMPILEPYAQCPSCEVFGAPMAELDPSGGVWWRTCWDCGYRWVQS
jgi:hypothetical protein